MKKKESGILFLMSMFLISFALNSACASKGNSKKAQGTMKTDSVSFTYSEITGIGVDSLFNRRDNSDIIKVGNKYYVWYTKMVSPETAGYWATIWYATSEDEGHTWKEEGMAIGIGTEGQFDSHSVFTPNILAYKGKYYLYYTGVQPTPGKADKIFENNSVK